jgi:hypothetical protein
VGLKHGGLLDRIQIPPRTALQTGDVIELEVLIAEDRAEADWLR